MIIEEVSFQLDAIKLAGLLRPALVQVSHADQPVLCLHGFLDNAASFLPLMSDSEFLPDYPIIALDLPGHGYSGHRSSDAHYHFFDYVSDLVNLFNQNNWSSAHIVAHSMGGMIASAFAAAFPEKVKSLTLIDTMGFVSAPPENASNQLRQGILSRIKKANPRRTFSEETAIKARLNMSDLKAEHAALIIKRSLIEAEQELSSSGLNTKYTWRADPRLRTTSPYRLTPEQGHQLLSDITSPLQLIYADKGMKTVVEGLSRYEYSLSDFTAFKVSGGHHVHMEQVQQVSSLINNFINSYSYK